MKTQNRFLSAWGAAPGIWFSIVALIGLLWNMSGAIQFLNSLSATEESLRGAMMTPEQVEVLMGLPFWVTLVFGVGVVTSLVGCVQLYLRHSFAKTMLIVSFLAFLLLSISYAVYGVFAALGTPQIAIMSTVVVVAAGLVGLSRLIDARENATLS
jgi:small basic protein